MECGQDLLRVPILVTECSEIFGWWKGPRRRDRELMRAGIN